MFKNFELTFDLDLASFSFFFFLVLFLVFLRFDFLDELDDLTQAPAIELLHLPCNIAIYTQLW